MNLEKVEKNHSFKKEQLSCHLKKWQIFPLTYMNMYVLCQIKPSLFLKSYNYVASLNHANYLLVLFVNQTTAKV